MALTATLLLRMITDMPKTVAGVVLPVNVQLDKGDAFADGTGLDQANKAYGPVRRTLAGAASETLDLSGTLEDLVGDAVVFTKVKGVFIHNTSVAVGANLEVGGGSNPFLLFKDATDIDVVGPDGRRLWWEPSLAGKPVTAATGDLLKVNNVSSPSVSIDYDIWIIGVG